MTALPLNPAPQTERLLVSVNDAAAMLSLSRRTVQSLQAAGELRPIRVGKLVRFAVDDLRAWVESKREAVL